LSNHQDTQFPKEEKDYGFHITPYYVLHRKV